MKKSEVKQKVPGTCTSGTWYLLLPIIGMLLLAGGGNAHALPPSDQALFEKGNIAYREGKFDEAAALYKALAEKYPMNAGVEFNLGNALYRKGETGPAILAYERARLSAPRNGDILYNYNYLRGLLEYKVEDKRSGYVRAAEKVLGYFTLEEVTLAAFLFVFLFLGSWVFVLFFKQDTTWGWFRKTLLILALVGVGLLAVKNIQKNFFSEAIVITKEAQVYFGPSVNDQPAFRLGEGLKVYVVDSREGWDRILIASGESGWIQKEFVTEIRP